MAKEEKEHKRHDNERSFSLLGDWPKQRNRSKQDPFIFFLVCLSWLLLLLFLAQAGLGLLIFLSFGVLGMSPGPMQFTFVEPEPK